MLQTHCTELKPPLRARTRHRFSLSTTHFLLATNCCYIVIPTRPIVSNRCTHIMHKLISITEHAMKHFPHEFAAVSIPSFSKTFYLREDPDDPNPRRSHAFQVPLLGYFDSEDGTEQPVYLTYAGNMFYATYKQDLSKKFPATYIRCSLHVEF